MRGLWRWFWWGGSAEPAEQFSPPICGTFVTLPVVTGTLATTTITSGTLAVVPVVSGTLAVEVC